MNEQMNNIMPCINDEIKENLKRIAYLQDNAVKIENNDEMCDTDFLGDHTLDIVRFNTRPLQLYTDDDEAWFCPIDRDNTDCDEPSCGKSCIFRVEKVEDCTATFRALLKIYEDGCHEPKFLSTNSFITIKLKNIAAMRCLHDTFVELCI